MCKKVTSTMLNTGHDNNATKKDKIREIQITIHNIYETNGLSHLS